jgi:ABC-2 type transport system permease protein
MKSVFLVAQREFRQVVATRGFWVMLLIMPLILVISGFASSRLQPERASAYTVVDASGQVAPLIEQRMELDYQRQALRGLSTYVERWKLAHVSPQAPWARPGNWVADAEVMRFAAAGGTDAALRLLKASVPKDAPPFEAPDRWFVKVDPPKGVPTDKGAGAFGKAMAKPLQEDVIAPGGKKLAYALAVYIPKDFGTPGAVVQVWTSGRPVDGLIPPLRDTLTTALRQRLLATQGVSPVMAMQFEKMQAPMAISEPPTGQGRSVIVTRSLIPIALVYLLLITTITTGSMMLQGLVEERSNKLIESVLACIKPAALMHGKLLGLGLVGMCVIGVWAGCAVGAAFWTGGAVADFLRPSLEAVQDPWLILAMLFYFLSGYVILSMVFLAIGSQSDSMQDAQAFLTPVLMTIMLPVMFLMQAALRDPNSLFVQVLSWIPFYTPFAMLARLGSGVSLVEILGSCIVVAAFIWLELVFLGRLFRASLLNTGKPKWRDMIAKLVAKSPSKQAKSPSKQESHNAA